ncbi:putative ATP-dependent RNA helicase dhx8 [Paratrimastix pyriformis]|uniref:RNA helicase n=1 Tax=Paratrimastix pyriformis TaxID=342808 RepID=A0ABQ8UU70_9EUKA|nr:putative ATP-dependent RNA helicase dhx8 [Paratrimastix pyriformis]
MQKPRQAFLGPAGLTQAGSLGSSVDRMTEKDQSQMVVYNPDSRLPSSVQRTLLPIFHQRRAILWCVEHYQATIIVGQTGSGKTTQIPQYLLEGGWVAPGRAVVCTQPRRIAAVTIAQHVAEERGCPIGGEVGYAVRFDVKSSPQTTIRYMTDGLLLREFLDDPLLTRYGVVMVDEAHERSVSTDVLLGLLKKVMRIRTDLKVIVSSATLDAGAFRDFFNLNPNPDVHHLETPAADYLQASLDTVLKIHASEPPGDILCFLTGQEEVDSLVTLLTEQEESKVSVSHPSNASSPEPSTPLLRSRHEPSSIFPICLAASLERIKAIIITSIIRPITRGLVARPLYAGLPPDQQMVAFEPAPPRTRKCVVATNIAEASVTVLGIAYVVDCGFAKIRVFDPALGTDALVVQPISQASATQRAGRAGRTRAGKCYRLYTEAAYRALKPQTIPEIQRANLAPVCLQLKSLGIDYLLHFDFPAPPSAEAMMRALELLFALGALTEHGRLTRPLGQRMAELPLDPLMSKMTSLFERVRFLLFFSFSNPVSQRMAPPLLPSCTAQLLESPGFGCSEEILSVAAMLSVQSVFQAKDPRRASAARRAYSVAEGDHVSLLNVYRAASKHIHEAKWLALRSISPKVMHRVEEIRNQLKRILQRFDLPIVSCGADVTPVQRCICAGFFANAATRQPDGTYRTIRDGVRVDIHPNSAVFSYPPACMVFHEVTLTTKRFASEVCAIDPNWLPELAPHFYAKRVPSQVAHQTHAQAPSTAAPTRGETGLADAFHTMFSRVPPPPSHPPPPPAKPVAKPPSSRTTKTAPAAPPPPILRGRPVVHVAPWEEQEEEEGEAEGGPGRVLQVPRGQPRLTFHSKKDEG